MLRPAPCSTRKLVIYVRTCTRYTTIICYRDTLYLLVPDSKTFHDYLRRQLLSLDVRVDVQRLTYVFRFGPLKFPYHLPDTTDGVTLYKDIMYSRACRAFQRKMRCDLGIWNASSSNKGIRTCALLIELLTACIRHSSFPRGKKS
jgi:hypothetical protein